MMTMMTMMKMTMLMTLKNNHEHQAAASMMSPPMSPAKKNAKDPDKPKVLYGRCPPKQPGPVTARATILRMDGWQNSKDDQQCNGPQIA